MVVNVTWSWSSSGLPELVNPPELICSWPVIEANFGFSGYKDSDFSPAPRLLHCVIYARDIISVYLYLSAIFWPASCGLYEFCAPLRSYTLQYMRVQGKGVRGHACDSMCAPPQAEA